MSEAIQFVQLNLIKGFYRCQDCDRDVGYLLRVRRFRLCQACYDRVVVPTSPGKSTDLTNAEYQARENFWRWYKRMENRYPIRYNWKKPGSLVSSYAADDFYPYCQCGNEKREMSFVDVAGLFGGPYFPYCPVCDAKKTVDSMFSMADKIFIGKDDEDILDQLLVTFPEIFDLGVLPDYWFELRKKSAK